LNYEKSKLKHGKLQEEEKKKEDYVIKNYRLIKKTKRDFFLPMTTQNSPRIAPISTSNTRHNSPVRVSNSILSPNTFHFSTRV
jgi:hypothetical protein